MNRTALINVIAQKTGLSKKDAAAALAATEEAITEALASGDKVQLTGFGTFDVKHREARTGFNLHTKQPIDIPASKIPTFKPGKILKDKI